MALDFVCGWECRQTLRGTLQVPDEAHWDQQTNSGPITISTATVRSGTASLRCNTTGAAESWYKDWDRPLAVGRVYVRWETFAANSGFARNAHVGADGTIWTEANGDIYCGFTGGDSALLGTATVGVWYRFDWLYDATGSTTTFKAQMDGVEQTVTFVQATGDITSVRFGNFASTTTELFFDDLLLGTAVEDYPFGAGTVEPMLPTRDGTHSFTLGDFKENGTTNIAVADTDVNTLVNNVDLKDTAMFVSQSVARSTGYLEVGFGSAPFTHDATGIMVVSSWFADGTGANTVGVKMNDGGTLRNLTDEAGDGLSDLSDNVNGQFHEKLVISPPSGGTWTKAKIDALLMRVGYSTDAVAIPYWNGMILEVAYSPSIAEAGLSVLLLGGL